MTYNITTAPKPAIITKRRALITISSIIVFPFLIAFLLGAGMGISKAMHASDKRGPNAQELAILQHANDVSSTPCWAEWNFTQNGFEVICGAKDNSQKDYNQGFADSKKDDCNEGSKPACDWVNAPKN